MPNATPEMRARRARTHGGEDTDDFRVFVLGLPRTAAGNSFIDRRMVDEAMSRPWVDGAGRPLVPADTPLVAGLDLARGGADGGSNTVMAFRAGLDGRSVRPVSIPGSKLEPRDRADWAIREATKPRPPYGKPVVCCYDATGLDGLFAEALRERGAADLFWPINFGSGSPNARFVNYRSSMWGELSRWLFAGGMLPTRDEALARTITAAGAEYDRNSKIAITAKVEIGKVAGDEKLDELDARLLSLHDPPVVPDSVRRRTIRNRRPTPAGRSWMGQ